MLVPKELKFEHSGGVKAMTTEQIERGIEIIKSLNAIGIVVVSNRLSPKASA